ncbi:hypothetical protein DNTS_024155 [Danionella cerebrum]|nr:hypothetical protein DNTS_024155 [Danionella translucida]
MRLRPLPAVELVDSSGVLEVASLLLFGTSAIPVRMKILLDRLFSVLTHSEVNRILSALDWSLQDYIRGYTLQDISGKVLDRWAVMSFDEEVVALQQFLRFGETKSIVERMALQDQEDQGVLVPGAYSGSEIQSFLEKSSSRPTEEQDASGSNRRHHFETALHSGGVVLPLLTSPPVYSCPAPFLSSPSGSQKPLAGLECTEVPLDGAGAFTTATTRAELLQENNSPKLELEELSLSGPSTPSEHTHGSPEVRTRCIDKSGSLKKGRVFCSACEKTFYDKGTLKIHFNAVHLKIKHRCTVEGCNMVFSSLRSRNRHSANPNPRLHMPINRNSRDKDIRGILCPGQDPGLGEDRSPSGSESKTSTGFLTRSSDPNLLDQDKAASSSLA